MYDIIFIDLDGTITESKPGIFNGIRYAAERLGLELPPEEILNKFIGPPLIYSFMKYMGLSKEEAVTAQTEYRIYYKKQGEFESRVYDGVLQMLEGLKASGKKLYVVTAKPEAASKRIISHFGLDKYFEQVCGATEDESRNNKTAVIRYAMEISGEKDLSKFVMVGDRSDDINGAKAAGIACIGVLYGYGDEEELTGAGADHLACTPQDAARFILDKNRQIV